MSISKQQAAALAEGFLDDLGSTEELRPKELYTEVILVAGEFAEEMQDNLVKSKSIASGELSESITVNEPVQHGTVFQADVTMNFYGKFINKGVKGTKGGTGQYQFKYDNPSKKMVSALEKYIKRAATSIRSVKKYSSHGSHESKNKSLAEISSAYALGRAIKMKGIKPTGFVDKAAKSIEKKFADRLGAALRIDLIDTIRNIP